MGTMSRWLTISSAVMVLGGPGALLAQGGKIGFVNSQEILYQTNEGKEGLAELERYMGQKRQEFETKNKELADLQQDYQLKRGTLNAEAVGRMERDIEQRQVELRRFQEDIQTDLQGRQDGLLQRLSEKVQAVIEEYAKQNTYDVIFMRDQSQAWVSPTLDVTQEIIRLYNQKNPGKGTGAAPANP